MTDKKTMKDLLKIIPKEIAEQHLQKIVGDVHNMVDAQEQLLRDDLAGVSPEALKILDDNKITVTEAASHSMSRVHDHIKNREVGYITAHRGEHSAEKNNENNHALAHDIRKAGYGHIPLRGSYVENAGTPHERKVSERSFMVIGKEKGKNTGLHKFLVHHGEKYGQESIIHKPHDSHRATSHVTSGPEKGQAHDIGDFHVNQVSNHQSSMKGGKKTFTFHDKKKEVAEGYFYLVEKSFFSRKERLFG